MAPRAIVAAAALVLCAAVLVAGAHAGRVIEYQALEAEAALAPLAAAASSPAAADVVADAGGVRRDDDRERSSTAIGDVLWFVLQWANEAAAGAGGDRRKTY